MASSKDGVLRHGSYRLDMPPYRPGESRNVAWLRRMVEDRRERGIPQYGTVVAPTSMRYAGIVEFGKEKRP